MIYNQSNLAVAKIADQGNITNPALAGVLITSKKTVATDRFRLVEVQRSAGDPSDYPVIEGKSAMRGMKPVLVDAREFHDKVKIKSAHKVAIAHRDNEKVEFIWLDDNGSHTASVSVIDDRFPDYERVFPEGEPKAEVVVNAKYLADILTMIGKMNEHRNVTMKLYGTLSPVLIEGGGVNQKARGLLMPIDKSH